MTSPLDTFFDHITSSLEGGTFVKIITSEKKDVRSELKSISIKQIRIKDGERLSFTYRYKTRDEVKNYTYDMALEQLRDILTQSFASLELFTTEKNIKIVKDARGDERLKIRDPEITETPGLNHDKQKHRYIQTKGNVALRELGVLSETFDVLPSMQDKFKQIDKFIEIIESLLKQIRLPNHLKVIDMGSWKGYLTFALYDYLTHSRHLETEVSGIELRPYLVEFCNNIATKVHFSGLHFHSGAIEDTTIVDSGKLNILMALHACDTATDDAIYKGIRADAEIIICSPCCHKQVRKDISVSHSLGSILKNGILEERQAEIITDGIRALLMEAHGYETKVFEYISSEHTGKNCMITGVKTNKQKDTTKILGQIAEIKQFFGIKHHHLEKLLYPSSI